jgi:hypothetical protein
VVLVLDSQLLAEIAEFESRAEGTVFDEQKIMLEKDFIIPNQLIIERLPIKAEENDDEDKYKSNILFDHERI